MTKSAPGTADAPGRHVATQAGLNRVMLDIGFGEIRRQIEYKAHLYGARVTAVDPAYTSQTCHRCGHTDHKSRRTPSLFHCINCINCINCSHINHTDIGAAFHIKNRATTD